MGQEEQHYNRRELFEKSFEYIAKTSLSAYFLSKLLGCNDKGQEIQEQEGNQKNKKGLEKLLCLEKGAMDQLKPEEVVQFYRDLPARFRTYEQLQEKLDVEMVRPFFTKEKYERLIRGWKGTPFTEERYNQAVNMTYKISDVQYLSETEAKVTGKIKYQDGRRKTETLRVVKENGRWVMGIK